jgi:hypothetical protein
MFCIDSEEEGKVNSICQKHIAHAHTLPILRQLIMNVVAPSPARLVKLVLSSNPIRPDL